MPLYFFHLRDGSDVLLDEDGRDLPGLPEVADASVREARSLISHEVMGGKVNLDQRIEVETADGVVVHRLAFDDAVEFSHSEKGAPRST